MAGELFKKAAAYRKKHPGLSMPDAVKAVAKGAKVSGVKKKKKTSAKPKRAVAVRTKGAKRPRKTVIAVKATVGALDRGLALVRDIKSLEARRKKLAGKEAKDLLALAINAKHDQLDTLKKRMKRA